MKTHLNYIPNNMKNRNTKIVGFIVLMLLASIDVYFYFKTKDTAKSHGAYTNIAINNLSKEDSVKVYVTLQSPSSVIGLFGIQDTIGSRSKGYFYAKQDTTYTTNLSGPLQGAVISFGGDNVPCQVAIQQGFLSGINIFEFSINIPYEVFDISCEDGVNCIIQSKVSDTLWTTGDGENIAKFDSAQNKIQIIDNVGIRGVFPYRCTDCVDLGKAVPENCFSLKDTCSPIRTCQVARTNHNGGVITINYKGSFQILK